MTILAADGCGNKGHAVVNATPAVSKPSTPKPPAPGNASPESEKNGAAAAKDLLSPTNKYFYNPILHRMDPEYSPETAKAASFLETLYGYEQKGDTADIAQLLNTLGPAETAKLYDEAGQLQGQQVTDTGTVFAEDQTGIDKVLGAALSAPGVTLGDGAHSGTLANNLIQQGTQSGSDALTIAAILNQSGTGAQVALLKSEFLGAVAVDGKALGNDTTDTAFFDRSSYAQAALDVINGDPSLKQQYTGRLGEQNGLLTTYGQLQQYANFNPSNPSPSYKAGLAAGQGDYPELLNDVNAHLNDPQWLAGYFQGLGPQQMAALLDNGLNPHYGAKSADYAAMTQALGAAAPYLTPSFEQALGQSVATQPDSIYGSSSTLTTSDSLTLDALLHNLNPGQNYGLLINVGKGYLSAAATQTGDRASISTAMAADCFSMAALDNPAGRTQVMAYLASQQQANPNFLRDFASQSVLGMAQLAGTNKVAIQGISPLMIALNQQSAGSAGNQMALQMFYGATETALGSADDPNVAPTVKGMAALISGEGSVGSHTIFVNGKPVQENLGLRTALMNIFYNNAPAILHQWEGTGETGGLGLNGQVQLERFTAFEFSPQGDPAVAQNNLDAMFTVAKRFVGYSLGKTSDPAITALVGTTESGKWAANVAGWILGSIAIDGNLSAQDLNQSAQAKAQAQQFADRVKYDWIGLGLDVIGLGSLGGMLGDAAPEVIRTIALWANNVKTGVGSATSLPRDWTFIQSDSALGNGPSIDTLPPQAQAQIMGALKQAGIQNIGVDQVMSLLEVTYSQNNLPDYKAEIDNQFGIAGGTDLPFAASPYMTALNNGGTSGVGSLSQWASTWHF